MMVNATGSEDVFPPSLIRKIVPFILLAVIVYVGVFFFVDATATLHQVRSVAPRCIVLAAQFALGSLLLRAIRWHHYLRVNQVRLRPWDSLVVFSIGLLLSLTPGKAGELMKSLLLKERWQVPVARTAPIVLAERITDLAAVLLLGGVGLLTVPGARVAGLLGVIAAMALVAVCTIRPLGLAAVRHVCRIGWMNRRREKLLAAYSSLTGVFEAGPLGVALALACGAWGLQSMCAWVIAGGFPDTHITVGQSLVVSCAPLLAGALALVPGGLGATEASMAGLLVALSGPGMSASEAAAITVLFRLVTLWLAVALGALAMGIWRVSRRRPSGGHR